MPQPSLGSESSFDEPVIGSDVIQQYRQAEDEYSSGHRGIDYRVSIGQGVFAPAAGKVHFVGEVVDRQLISLAHPWDVISSFEPVCSQLELGQKVEKGELIGEVCEGKASYRRHCEPSDCLHFSIRKSGEYLSPQWYLGDLSPSRLLPWINPENTQALG